VNERRRFLEELRWGRGRGESPALGTDEKGCGDAVLADGKLMGQAICLREENHNGATVGLTQVQRGKGGWVRHAATQRR
jgi:hypothetical protein